MSFAASPGPTLDELARGLQDGRITSRALTEACLERIGDPAGEGARAFVSVAGDAALQSADAMDVLRRAGSTPGPYAGIPIAIKDLFDIRGQVTTAGSRVLSDEPPAPSDAPSVSRLRRAGFVLIGRTNMTEFAYSGLGLNPHYGTPASVWDRATGRAPGGSTSGGAIAVADGMAHAALGTDTGGSCRIPAAFNRLVGWKPTARRMPNGGLVPLSPSLDSIGSIARSVACCATLDAILCDSPDRLRGETSLAGLRFLAPTTVVLDDLDPPVAQAYQKALSRISAAGARIVEAEAPELRQLLDLSAGGGLSAAESHAWHRRRLAKTPGDYDPRVASRISAGAKIGSADYIDLQFRRAELVSAMDAGLAAYDAMVLPSIAIVPPLLADLVDDTVYATTNLIALRNAMLINLMDGCAISLPTGERGTPPTGLMLSAAGGDDTRLLRVARAVERALRADKSSSAFAT